MPKAEKKKILWLSHFVPFPPKGGAFQRSFNLIRELSRQHDVYLVAIRHRANTHPKDEVESAEAALGLFCTKVKIIELSGSSKSLLTFFNLVTAFLSKYSLTLGLYNSGRIKREILSAYPNVGFDLVHFDSISVAQYVKYFPDARTVLNHHGAEGFMMKRRVGKERNFFKKQFCRFEARKLLRNEKELCPLFDRNIVVSDLDLKLLQSIAIESKFDVIENGVDLNFFKADGKKTPCKLIKIIFAGRLDQYANLDGIIWFVKEVMPLLRKTEKQYELTIIGANASKDLIKLAEVNEDISLLGYVDDVRPIFSQSAICVTPLRTGGGTRIKILDAMAMEIPIVATEIACEGLEIVPESELLVANTPQDFVKQIDRLVTDSGLRTTLVANAKQKITEHYSWDVIGKKLNDLYSSL